MTEARDISHMTSYLQVKLAGGLRFVNIHRNWLERPLKDIKMLLMWRG